MPELMRTCSKLLEWSRESAQMFGLNTEILYQFPPELRGTKAELMLRIAAEGAMDLATPATDQPIPSFSHPDTHAVATGYCLLEHMQPDTPYSAQIYEDIVAMKTGLQRIAYHYSAWINVPDTTETAQTDPKQIDRALRLVKASESLLASLEDAMTYGPARIIKFPEPSAHI